MARKGPARVITLEEFKRVEKIIELTRYKKRNLAIIYLSFTCGLRACEIRRIKVGDVLEVDGNLKYVVNLTKTKGNKPREMFITNEKTRRILMSHINEMKLHCEKKRIPYDRSLPLFLSQKGYEFLPNHMVRLICSFYKMVGLDQAKSHSGRRTIITKLIDEGYNLKLVSSFAGHNYISTTLRYYDANTNKLMKMAEKSIF